MSIDSITIETIFEAEKLLGVAYTEAERALMLENLAGQIDLARRQRGLALPIALAPASLFDPRLPTTIMPAPGPFRPSDAPVPPLPDDDADIALAPLTALSGWIRTRAIRSARLTEIYLERIARMGPILECIAVATPELARDQARRADARLAAGDYLGPLHGIPWGCKDIVDTAGIVTGWGAEPYRGRVPTSDAAVVRKLEAAGAVMVAKTTVGALASARPPSSPRSIISSSTGSAVSSCRRWTKRSVTSMRSSGRRSSGRCSSSQISPVIPASSCGRVSANRKRAARCRWRRDESIKAARQRALSTASRMESACGGVCSMKAR